MAVFVSFLNPFFGFWACVLFYRVAVHFESDERGAVFGALALGATTSLWPYSVHDHTENLQMLVYLAAYLSLVRGSGARPLKTGLLVAALVLIKPANLVATLPCAVYVLKCAPSPRVGWSRLSWLGLPISIAVAVVLGLNVYRFGQLLEFGYGGAMSFDLSQAPFRLAPLLLSLEEGLLTFSPVLLLALIAWSGFMARWPREGWFALGLFAVLLALTASFVPRGGWQWGPRYLVPTIPFLLLPLFQQRAVGAAHRLLTAGVLVSSRRPLGERVER